MENNNTKVVTFENHYSANLFKKETGEKCKLRPVPRSISSSCGTCAFVNGITLQEILEKANPDTLEAVFECDRERYIKIYG